ncbi:MAG: DinB family protein [Janthinobacterium lividum]
MPDLTLPTAQYALVQSARAALLDYCATLAPAAFTTALPGFGGSSIGSLLVHVANTYRHWLGIVGQQQAIEYYDPAEATNLAAVRQLFAEVDALATAYYTAAAPNWLDTQLLAVPGQPGPLALSPLTLFTHVLTHEFHHKGQVLSMSRQLGYPPVDTDVIRF